MSELLIYFFMECCTLPVIKGFFDIFLDKRNLGKKVWIWNLLFCLVGTFSDLGFMPPYLNIFYGALTYELIAITFFEGAFSRKTFVNVIFVAVWMLDEAIVGLVFGVIGISYREQFLLGAILTRLVIFLLEKIIQYFYVKKNDIPVERKEGAALLVFPVVSIILMFCIFVLCQTCTNRSLRLGITVVSLLLIPMNIFQFRIYDKIKEKAKVEKRNLIYQQMVDLYEKQIAEREETTRKIRQFRHDMKLHLSAVWELAEEKDTDGIISYIDELANGPGMRKSDFANSGNLLLDGLLNQAYERAVKAKIQMKLRLEIPYKLNISDADLYVILGNALENALEASEKVPQEEGRLIELSLVYKNGDLRIGIRNRYAEEPRKDSKGTFLSSKNNSEYHGIGLYSIRETVKKYHGFMDIHTENKIFSLVIVIREEKSC